MFRRLIPLLGLLLVASMPAAAQTPQFEGVKVCAKCHDLQADAWKMTPHAKAFASLKPGAKAEVKLKAKLDPEKDYTQDTQCIGCHVTGYGAPGGYEPGMAKAAAGALAAVGCESCHGAGGEFRKLHGEAENKLKREAERTERSVLVAAGQNFDYEAACARCHLNFEGSGLHGAKPPFTPFTPAVSPDYAFDFAKAVRGKAIHTHYKLSGVFTGEPVSPLRDEFQKTAEEPE